MPRTPLLVARLVGAGVIGLAVLSPWLSGPPAQAATAPHRLSGSYQVDERVQAQSLPPREAAWKLDQTFHVSWALHPGCATGICATSLNSSDGLISTTLSPGNGLPGANVLYTGSLAPVVRACTLPGNRTIPGAYDVSGDVRLAYGAAGNIFSGTLVEAWTPNGTGTAAGCVFDRVTLAVTTSGAVAATSVPTTSPAQPSTSTPSSSASRGGSSGATCPFSGLSAANGFGVWSFITGLPFHQTNQPTGTALEIAPCAGADPPAFSHGKVYIGDLYTGNIYVFGSTGGDVSQATLLPDAHFGKNNLFSIVFGPSGEMYATLWGPQGNALQPEIVELDSSTGAEVRTVATLSDGLTYCPGRPAISPLTGGLFVPGNCYGGQWGTDAITVIANPNSAHPLVSTFATLPGALGGLAFAPDGSLYAEAGWFAAPEPVVQVAGPGTQLLVPVQAVGYVPGGFSYGLTVSARGGHGKATALQATDWKGNVYTLNLASHPATVATDVSSTGATGTGFSAGLGWGAVQLKGCLYIPAGPSIERVCGAPTNVGALARSLPLPSKAFSPLSSDLVNAGVAVVAALFLTFPADIFNDTFAENYAQISAWWAKWANLVLPPALRRGLLSGGRRALQRLGSLLRLSGRSREKRLEREWVTFGLVVVAGALLGALLDPGFGLNLVTALSFVAVAGALVAAVALEGLVTHFYHRARRHGRVRYKVEALPGGLLIALLCVLVSRGAGFQPGYLYGIIAGVVFGRELAKHEQAHVVVIHALARLAVGLGAWLLWAALYHVASQKGSFFAAVLADDFLAAFFVTTLVSTVISLLPLRFMPGRHLKDWKPGVWVATFVVALFLVVQVLLRPSTGLAGGGSHSHVPLVTTLALFAAFGAASLGFREYFARQERRKEHAEPAEESEASMTVRDPDGEPAAEPVRAVSEE